MKLLLPRGLAFERLWFRGIAAAVVLFAGLAALAPGYGYLSVTVLVILALGTSSFRLLVMVLVFGMVSTLPQIAAVAELVQVDLLPGTSLNFVGLVRTALAGVTTVICAAWLTKQWGTSKPYGRWVVILLGYATAGLVWVPRWALGEGLRSLVQWYLAFGVFLLSMYVAQRRRSVFDFMRLGLVLALILSIGSLVTQNFLPEITEQGVTDLDRGARLIGLTVSPNLLAGNLTVFATVGFVFFVTPRIGRRWRSMGGLAFVVTLIPLALTFSRSGWIGVGLGVGLALWLRRKWLWLLPIGLLALVVIVSPLGNRFLGDWQAALSGSDWATTRGFQNAYGRIEYLWKPAVAELVTPASAVIGRGPGTAQAWAFSYSSDALHSELLQIWLDYGLVGLGVFLMLFWQAAWHSYRLFRYSRSPLFSGLGLAGLSVMAAMLPKMLWDHLFNGPNGWLLLIVLGLVLGIEKTAVLDLPERRPRRLTEAHMNADVTTG